MVGGTPAVEMPSPAIIQPTSLSLTSFPEKDQTKANAACGIEVQSESVHNLRKGQHKTKEG